MLFGLITHTYKNNGCCWAVYLKPGTMIEVISPACDWVYWAKKGFNTGIC